MGQEYLTNEVELAFARHATSKLRTADDLSALADAWDFVGKPYRALHLLAVQLWSLATAPKSSLVHRFE